MSFGENYIRKNPNVEAVQVTPKNIRDVARWFGGSVSVSDAGDSIKQCVRKRVFIGDFETMIQAFIGDWIIREHDDFVIYPEMKFYDIFKKSEESS